jgi:hypothetical protein
MLGAISNLVPPEPNFKFFQDVSLLSFLHQMFFLFRYLSPEKSSNNGDDDYDIGKKEVSLAISFKRFSGCMA